MEFIAKIIEEIVVNCFQNPIFRDDSQVGSAHNVILLVVNCFQNPIFRDDSQEKQNKNNILTSCELLSESYF